MKNIGWIGLGNMGNPMAINLLKSGYSVFIYCRNQEKKDLVSQHQAIAVYRLDDLVEQTDVIFLTLPDDAVVQQTITQLLDFNLSGKTFINSSTISPALAVHLAQALLAKGAFYLDAPVSGSVKPAQEGTLSFLIGGDLTDYQRCIPLFEVLGKHHYYLGTSGAGSKAKLAINYYMSVVIQGLAETVLFAEKNGISRDLMTSIINDGACGSGISRTKTPALLSDKYPAAFPLKFMLKDIRLAQLEGWDTPLLQTVENTYNQAAQQGLSEEDLMAVIQTIRN